MRGPYCQKQNEVGNARAKLRLDSHCDWPHLVATLFRHAKKQNCNRCRKPVNTLIIKKPLNIPQKKNFSNRDFTFKYFKLKAVILIVKNLKSIDEWTLVFATSKDENFLPAPSCDRGFRVVFYENWNSTFVNFYVDGKHCTSYNWWKYL